jgi:Rhodopirellula transposase DDE domain
VIARIEKLMEYETAGDPMTGLKWSRKTLRSIAEALRSSGVQVSANTVGRLLREMDYSLHANRKTIAATSAPDRNEQMLHIARTRKRFTRAGNPVVSVDTKKKELVGQFSNGGVAWSKSPLLVNDHDFRSTAVGMAIPYGIYDPTANRGAIFVGTSHDTPQFAVECISRWWYAEGRRQYPGARRLLILADGGGSNGPTCRLWKERIQADLCDRYGISVAVSHYPTGASKWNIIEHRLFSEISKEWAGRPLDRYGTILNYIRRTKTEQGLTVTACLIRKKYSTGIKVTDEEMKQLRLVTHPTLPRWNYTLRPRKNVN